MTPLQPTRKNTTESRVHCVLDLAQRTADQLNDCGEVPPTLHHELDRMIRQSLPLPPSAALSANVDRLDSLGCHIWNAATNMLRGNENDAAQPSERSSVSHLVVSLRVFASLLLESGYRAVSKRKKDRNLKVRNIKIALKACRFSLDQGEQDLALKLLEICSEHIDISGEDSPLVQMADSHGYDHLHSTRSTLRAELILLRVLHGFKSNSLDMADHFYHRLSLSDVADSASMSESAAKIFFEAGKSLVKQHREEVAFKWLKRALGVLDAGDPELMNQEAVELRLASTATLIDALRHVNSPDSLKAAQDLIDQLYAVHGMDQRIAVHLMQLNLLLVHPSTSSDKIYDVMKHILRTSILSDHTFKIIMLAIHRAFQVDARIAYESLNYIITSRLLPSTPTSNELKCSTQIYLDKVCVTYVVFATKDPAFISVSDISELEKTMTAIVQRTNNGLSETATHAAQTLIWKAVGAAIPDVAEGWTRLLRHPVFDNAGPINKARIGRRSIVTAMECNDLDGARGAFHQMPTAAQNEAVSRYLAFKLAVKSDDYDLAMQSLKILVDNENSEPTFLYACVFEAQRSGMRRAAVTALQALLDKRPLTVHLPSLLRCTARLLIGELENQKQITDGAVEDVVEIFENAASNIQVFRSSNNEQSSLEVEWWSKNAYNLALKLCSEMHLGSLVRLLWVCTKFLNSSPPNIRVSQNSGLQNRRAVCHFLCATALVVLGRSTRDNTEYRLQCYLQARKEIAAFGSLQERDDLANDSKYEQKALELLKLDLECILNLQQWNELDEVLQRCLEFEHLDRWDRLADTVLILHREMYANGIDSSPNGHMAKVLERIINDTWQKERDIVKASRWLRLSFSADLSDGSGEFAVKLLQQAAGMAKKASKGTGDEYPETELQWLAATAFNRAVDLLSNGVSGTPDIWIDAALELARYATDNGALHANLTYKKEAVMERAMTSRI